MYVANARNCSQLRTGVQACGERQVVSTVWSHVQQLLMQDKEATEAFVRGLAAVLPDPCSLTSQELPELAKLHLSSAHNLMATMRLVAPAAFTKGSQPDLAALDQLEGGVLTMVSTLIELQLFHLQRAAALTAHRRERLWLAQQASQGATAWSASSSGCTDSHDDAQASS